MKLVIINGSVQADNGSQITSELLRTVSDHTAEIVNIAPFSELFHGKYTYFSNATPEQRTVMTTIATADSLVFVVPTYFKSLPGGLKNFLDIVREKSLYEHKAIAFVASNHKNQDFGARDTLKIIEGILEFFETQAVFVPEIGIINPEQPDMAVAQRVIGSLGTLHDSYLPKM